MDWTRACVSALSASACVTNLNDFFFSNDLDSLIIVITYTY